MVKKEIVQQENRHFTERKSKWLVSLISNPENSYDNQEIHFTPTKAVKKKKKTDIGLKGCEGMGCLWESKFPQLLGRTVVLTNHHAVQITMHISRLWVSMCTSATGDEQGLSRTGWCKQPIALKEVPCPQLQHISETFLVSTHWKCELVEKLLLPQL